MKIFMICLLIIYFLYIIYQVFLYVMIKRYKVRFLEFGHSLKDDLLNSNINVSQKQFPFFNIYNLLASISHRKADKESIYFNYNDYNYLIVFSKGQYGIATGGEIAVYRDDNSNLNGYKMFVPNDEEMLYMGLNLYRNNNFITQIDDKNWWVAAFKLGLFSNPRDLKMDIYVTFPNEEFLKSFIIGFKNLGYKENDYVVIGNTFMFTFLHPKTRKVLTRNIIRDYFVQRGNRKKINVYQNFDTEEKNFYSNEFLLSSFLLNGGKNEKP